MVPYPGRRGEFRLKTAVKAIEQAGMHVETGRSVVPAEAGTHGKYMHRRCFLAGMDPPCERVK